MKLKMKIIDNDNTKTRREFKVKLNEILHMLLKEKNTYRILQTQKVKKKRIKIVYRVAQKECNTYDQ